MDLPYLNGGDCFYYSGPLLINQSTSNRSRRKHNNLYLFTEEISAYNSNPGRPPKLQRIVHRVDFRGVEGYSPLKLERG
jgi:hypothetical protein